jgi:hypothetical protein
VPNLIWFHTDQDEESLRVVASYGSGLPIDSTTRQLSNSLADLATLQEAVARVAAELPRVRETLAAKARWQDELDQWFASEEELVAFVVAQDRAALDRWLEKQRSAAGTVDMARSSIGDACADVRKYVEAPEVSERPGFASPVAQKKVAPKRCVVLAAERLSHAEREALLTVANGKRSCKLLFVVSQRLDAFHRRFRLKYRRTAPGDAQGKEFSLNCKVGDPWCGGGDVASAHTE